MFSQTSISFCDKHVYIAFFEFTEKERKLAKTSTSIGKRYSCLYIAHANGIQETQIIRNVITP